MAANAAPVKTQLGLEELRGRARTLGQRHRTVLLLVDGKRPLAEVLALALQAGAQTSHFEDLVRMGMVELPSAGMVPDARDSAPSAFDALRVTSVELEVRGPSAPSDAADDSRANPLDAEPAPSAPAAASAAAPDRTVSDHPKTSPPPSHPTDNPPSRAGALGPPVDPVPRAAPVQDDSPSLHGRQLPLAAVVKPASAASPPLPAPPAPVPPRPPASPAPAAVQVRTPVPPAAVPSRRMPLELTPAAPKIPPPMPAAAPAPAARGGSVLPPAPARSRITVFGDSAASGGRAASPASGPSSVSGALPLRPAQPPIERSIPPASAPKGIPTLPMGSASPAGRTPARRSVLSRLASPRAGSLRVPDEPAVARLERVRELLVETLRIDAPLFGMRMLVRLRAATSADDLIELVWDIERHLITARHSRDEMLSLQRARELLGLGNTVVADDD